MLSSTINYPYPVLRSRPIDYLTSTFDADITVSPKDNGFEILVHYNLNADHVQALINTGVVSFGIEIECTSTWYRSLKMTNATEDKIFLPSVLVHQRVDVCPCIVSRKTIQNYECCDFAEEFREINYTINNGEVLGIGDGKKFDALYKEDIIKKSDSIIHFSASTSEEVENVEWDYDVIQIHLPVKQWELYDQIGKYEPWKIPVLNAIYASPVITEAVTIICNDYESGNDGSMSNYAWYKTIKYLIGRLAKNDQSKFKKLLMNAISTTQILLNDNAAISISLLEKCDKRSEV